MYSSHFEHYQSGKLPPVVTKIKFPPMIPNMDSGTTGSNNMLPEKSAPPVYFVTTVGSQIFFFQFRHNVTQFWHRFHMNHHIPCYLINSESCCHKPMSSWKSHFKLFSVTTGGINCGVIFSLVPPETITLRVMVSGTTHGKKLWLSQAVVSQTV